MKREQCLDHGTILALPVLVVLAALGPTACRTEQRPEYAAAAVSRLRKLDNALRAYQEKCGGFPAQLSSLTKADDPCSIQLGTDFPKVTSILEGTRVVGEYEWLYSTTEALPSPKDALFKKFELTATPASPAAPPGTFVTSEAGLMHHSGDGPPVE